MSGPNPKPIKFLRYWIRLVAVTFFAALSVPANPVISAPAGNVGIRVPILAYHNIAVNPGNDPWTISTAEFAAELDVLQSNGYQTVTLQDYLDYENNVKTPPAKPIILTFDDGYEGMYSEVLPALTSRGLVASFFIPTGKIVDAEPRMDNSWTSSTRLDYHLIWTEIQALADAGMEIGSHTVTHRNLTGLSPLDVEQELALSKTALESHLPGVPITSVAYPHGEGGDDLLIRAKVETAGYLLALDYDPPDAVAEIGVSTLFNLPRRNMKNGVTQVLNCQNPWWFFMRRVDPLFPLTDISLTGIEIRDIENHLRSKMVPGETASVRIKAMNSEAACSADVSATLVIEKGGEVVYDSHQQIPSEDITLNPFPNTSSDQNFVYSWQIPMNAATGMYEYRFCVYDDQRLRTHYCSPLEPLGVVGESPIYIQPNVNFVQLSGTDLQQIDFSIFNSVDLGKDTYMTVSISPNLRIDEVMLVGPWTHYRVGDTLNCKVISSSDCTGNMSAVYETFVVYLKDLPTGSQTFSLPVGSKPGAGEDEWLRYRLRVDFSPNPLGDGEASWPLRWPWYGTPDQQGWYAAVLPVEVSRSDVFIPAIIR